MSSKVLVIGSGGREHAICWKISQSPKISQIFALPGSYGIGQLPKVQNLTTVNVKNFQDITKWCKTNAIDLVIVGPEDPLALGLADDLEKEGIKCFGPKKRAAQIESNKQWAKEFMVRHKIPTARFETFNEAEKAKNFIKNAPFEALVIKANGLAAGKGVTVASNTNEAYTAIDHILKDRKFGSAGDIVVVEEKLTGEEISVLAFVDSKTVKVLLPAQDHKRLKENDEGPNTGGMGAYCPCPLITNEELNIVEKIILEPAVNGFRNEGIPYCGILYAGLMLTPNGPKVLEFNCRFGDPETQVILPLLQSDLYEIMNACCTQTLSEIKLQWKNQLTAVGVVMASAGYPETSTKGCIIEGIPNDSENQIIFQSGVAKNDAGNYITNGGRVLISVCLDSDLKLAAKRATQVCHNIKFSGSGAQFRNDIAQKAFKFHSISLSYKDSGVDIDAGDDLVQRIKPLARGSLRKGVVGTIGGFGGLFSLNELPYKNPILCESTKSVGAKIKIALEYESYEGIGYDLVAMCSNDVLESGAEPIAFLDYIACGKLQVPIAAQFIKGMSDGCRDSVCALLGGETAEMPSLYTCGKYDMAGYCVGVLEDGMELPRYDTYEDGDIIIGLKSNGIHCAGLDIVYEIIQLTETKLNEKVNFGDQRSTIGAEILKPSKIYVNDILPIIQKGYIKAISHISSGLVNGIEKIIPPKYQAEIDFKNVQLPEIFGWLAINGKISDQTLLDNFNCGIGLILVISKSITNWNDIPNSFKLGNICKTQGKTLVNIKNFDICIEKALAPFFNIENITRERHITKAINIKYKFSELLDKIQRPEVFLTQNGKRLTAVRKSFKDPILVIGTDGVGTKLKIALATKNYSTVGIDLVAMCANDILCNGAEPFTFLSYYASEKIKTEDTKQVTMGIVEGCHQANTSLIDTEIIEFPLLYTKDVFDLGGFSLGIADKENLLPKINSIRNGDIVIGIPSSGVHSNGFSLVHKIMELSGTSFDDKPTYAQNTFGEELLIPTKIYVDMLKPIISQKLVKGLAHITGGGLIENIPRILTKELCVQIDAKNFNIPPIFGWLALKGNIKNFEMQRTFNCGLGIILIVDPLHENKIMDHLHLSHRATKLGIVKKRLENQPQVIVENFDECMERLKINIMRPKKKVAVLISGSGTNLQALINATKDSSQGLNSDIVLVISNKKLAFGLKRAEIAGIKNIVLSHNNYKTREDFDKAMSDILEENNIDIVCLAGFMRILTEQFVKKWKGKLINIHPSLLPKYPGLNVQQRALEEGEIESGCTVHFVDEGVDTGDIIVQEKIQILKTDTVETLTEKIHQAEYYAYPKALRLLATDTVYLNEKNKAIFNY